MVYFFLSFIYLCIWFSGFFLFLFFISIFSCFIYVCNLGLFLYQLWLANKNNKSKIFIYSNSIATIEIVSIDKAE